MKGWVVALILAGLAALALIAYKMTKSKFLGGVSAALAEKLHQPRIAELNARLAELNDALDFQDDAVLKAKAKLRDAKDDLRVAYRDSGLSASEIATRMQGLKL